MHCGVLQACQNEWMGKWIVVLVAVGVVAGCHAKDKVEPSDAGITVTTATPTATTKPAVDPPPVDPAAFLTRFCSAVGTSDKGYINAHTSNGSFSSEQATDPAKCGGRTGKRCKRVYGGQNAEANFGPVCTRIGAQPSLAKATREEAGQYKVRLSDGDLISDLVIEKSGRDFRLLKEVIPSKSPTTAAHSRASL